MKNCPRCESRVKDWNGSDPRCAFSGSEFNPDNWNCATMNDLRDIVESSQVYNDDNYSALIALPDRELGDYLILSWYKRRGCTDGAWILTDNKMSLLTWRTAEAICVMLEKKEDK